VEAKRVLMSSVLAVCLGLLAFAAPASAAEWLTPANLSESGQNANSAQVAMGPTGDALAVWARSNGTNTIVQAATKPTFSQAWSTPESLSAAGQNATVPQVAFDASGDAVAVWLRFNGANTIVQAAGRPAGGSWSTPEDLSGAGQDATAPQVVMGPTGEVLVVWTRFNGTNKIIQAASRPTGAGAWSAPANLSEAGQDAGVAQLAIDPAGDAVAVWERSNGVNTIIQAAKRPAGGAWAPPTDLSEPGLNANGASVAIDAAGNAVAVWNRISGANTIMQASSAPAGSSWSTATDISEAGPSTGAGRVALRPGGEAIAVWRRNNGVSTVIETASRPIGGSWSTPQTLSESGQSTNQPRIAIDPAGNAFVVWNRAGALTIQVATKPPGGPWSTPTSLSESGGSALAPQIAVDSGGDAVVVWQRSNGPNTIVQANGFATGPHLRSASIPSGGVVGQAVSFSASWWDAWSPLAPIEWTLGDGTGAEGGAVSHAYSAPGIYSVAATVTDLRGASAAVGGEVAITPVPVNSQPGHTGDGSGQAGSGSGSGGASPAGAGSPGTKKHRAPSKKHHQVRHQKKAGLTVSLAASTGFARPTSVLSYRITVANPGGAAAHAVKVCAQLPPGQTALRAQPDASGGAEPCWSLGTLSAGARRKVSLSVEVGAFAAGGTELARAMASAADVAGTRVDTAKVRIRALPATACGSSLSGPASGHIAMRC
jgi:uncharacterized repeat protein (TIGR01451 family)